MKGTTDLPRPNGDSGIPTSGARIRSDESWVDQPALHDFAHTRIARFGCAAIAIGILVLLGIIVIPVVNSIRSANRAEVALAKAYRELTAQKFPAAIAS